MPERRNGHGRLGVPGRFSLAKRYWMALEMLSVSSNFQGFKPHEQEDITVAGGAFDVNSVSEGLGLATEEAFELRQRLAPFARLWDVEEDDAYDEL